MKRLFATNPASWAPLFARVILGCVIFPHGAQKLLAWFAGYGWEGTMEYMTGQMKLPWIIGFLVIMIEFFGSLALIAGFFTRIVAFAMFINFVGIIFYTQLNNGFFMNWYMLPEKPEGYEYHLLVLGISLVLIISGGGKLSMDAAVNYFWFDRKKRGGGL